MDAQLQTRIENFLVKFGTDYAPNYAELANYRTIAKQLAVELVAQRGGE